MRYIDNDLNDFVHREKYEKVVEVIRNLTNLIDEKNIQVENHRNIMDKQLEDFQITLNTCFCDIFT